MIGLTLTQVTVGYLLSKKEGGTEVGEASIEVWHNMSGKKLEELVGMFMDTNPPAITAELFCIYVSVYCDIEKENDIICLTKELYETYEKFGI